MLLEHYAFFNFASHYLANRTVDKSFQVDDAVMNDFKQFLNSQQIAFTEQDLSGVSDWVKANIKADIFTTPVRPGAGTSRPRRMGPDDQSGHRLSTAGPGTRGPGEEGG